MLVKHYSEVTEEDVDLPDVKDVSVRWLIDDATGIKFAMRRYQVKGNIPVHKHSHEHGVYVLSGSGSLLISGDSITLKPGFFIHIPPNELHGFKGSYTEPLTFLCIVPKERGEAKLMQNK